MWIRRFFIFLGFRLSGLLGVFSSGFNFPFSGHIKSGKNVKLSCSVCSPTPFICMRLAEAWRTMLCRQKKWKSGATWPEICPERGWWRISFLNFFFWLKFLHATRQGGHPERCPRLPLPLLTTSKTFCAHLGPNGQFRYLCWLSSTWNSAWWKATVCKKRKSSKLLWTRTHNRRVTFNADAAISQRNFLLQKLTRIWKQMENIHCNCETYLGMSQVVSNSPRLPRKSAATLGWTHLHMNKNVCQKRATDVASTFETHINFLDKIVFTFGVRGRHRKFLEVETRSLLKLDDLVQSRSTSWLCDTVNVGQLSCHSRPLPPSKHHSHQYPLTLHWQLPI